MAADSIDSGGTVTPEDLASYLDFYPSTLRCWASGMDSRYPMLAWVNAQAVADLRDAFTHVGPTAVRLSPVLHNQAGTAVSWAIEHLGLATREDAGERSRRQMWELARGHWVTSNLLNEVRCASRGFEAIGNSIRLRFVGDPSLDALDRMLDLLTEVRGMDVEGRPSGRETRDWLDAGGRDTPWTDAPPFVHAHYRASARALIKSYPRYLPDDLNVGGFTMGEAALVLTELLARAQYSQACLMRFSTSAAATNALLPARRPRNGSGD